MSVASVYIPLLLLSHTPGIDGGCNGTQMLLVVANCSKLQSKAEQMQLESKTSQPTKDAALYMAFCDITKQILQCVKQMDDTCPNLNFKTLLATKGKLYKEACDLTDLSGTAECLGKTDLMEEIKTMCGSALQPKGTCSDVAQWRRCADGIVRVRCGTEAAGAKLAVEKMRLLNCTGYEVEEETLQVTAPNADIVRQTDENVVNGDEAASRSASHRHLVPRTLVLTILLLLRL